MASEAVDESEASEISRVRSGLSVQGSIPIPIGLIVNIPTSYGSADLRRFFTDFVEGDKLDLFHYRRRPFRRTIPEIFPDSILDSSVPNISKEEKTGSVTSSNCAIFKIVDARQFQQFKHKYSGKPWHDLTNYKCYVIDVIDLVSVLEQKCQELRSPPALTPKGNVGTPTNHFKKGINECKVPTRLIKKLGLEFGAAGRKFCAVGPPQCLDEPDRPDRPEDDHGHNDFGKYLGEEWERHNSLNNDVSARRVLKDPQDFDNQPGTKERLFESEEEVTWEKGGSGLVFYTDAQYWHNAANDEDRDVDDWDVDTSVYYEPSSSCSMDAKTRRDMDLSDRYRSGKRSWSCFVMKKHGWKEGSGLGASGSGIKRPIEAKGQVDRSGLGYKELKDPPWRKKAKKTF